ncbi:50S ribosomal protein L23 [Halovenus sp. WSH3]|uniref:Large ribosomal subunit protein uL23 n=1 Tax=Halovenus carboxidivorans TaxID=2692199 RepID=A0A6B0T3E1_9EURY|nr:50S ribosomal protein L23 [Halovenus carboxidivorans]MXR52545.1 50S ribosomal protein L23 [Halovenus carboxidivorans]
MTDAIKHPHVTEKTVDKMDFDNKMVFICHTDAEKGQIKTEVEEQFDLTVTDVNTMVTPNGEKKAELTLSDEHDAQEVASRIGVF